MRLATFRQQAMIQAMRAFIRRGWRSEQAARLAVECADALVKANTVPDEADVVDTPLDEYVSNAGRYVFGKENTTTDEMTEEEAAMIWLFQEAPERLRRLSSHGGDEDWLVLVPKRLAVNGAIVALLETTHCSVSRCELPNDDVVYIGAHA